MNYDQQLQVEDTMFAHAHTRRDQDNYKTAKREAWSESKIGRAYANQASSKFTHLVASKLEAYNPSLGRINNRAITLLVESKLEAEVMAHLYTKTLYNLVPLVHRKRLRKTTLCMKVGECLHDELRIRYFAEEKTRKNLLKTLFKQFDKRTYPRDWRKKTILNYFHAEQISWQGWTQEQKGMVGDALFTWFTDLTGLLSLSKSGFVDPVPALITHVSETLESRVLEFMLYQPMLTNPVPWSSEDNLFKGGYLSSKVRPYPLVKGTGKKDYARLMSQDWSQVIPAINALQETGWRVNKAILSALEWAVARGGGVAGLPASDPLPLPPRPLGYKVDEEITEAHNQVCFLIHSANREMISKRLMLQSTISIANAFKDYPRIAMPHNLDSRGRAYPLPVFLNPQGPDWTKSLLEFSEGKPIDTEDALNWLCIAGANAYGNDKVALSERVAWVHSNRQMILEIAHDYQNDLRWQSASEPFQFLRFAFEFAAFSAVGFGFLSHMVVPVDATCSGLQHYSMMLADSVGGRSVNLVPGLPRQDIYGDVAEKTIEKLFRESNQFPVECKNLLAFGIDRKITKRTTMVVPYSATFSACMSYTREGIADKIAEGHPCTWNTEDNEEHTRHTVLLSKLIWESIGEVVIKASEAMRWLTKASQEHTKYVNKHVQGSAYDKRMTWVTPDGFEVVHYRADVKKKQIATYLDGKTRKRMQINVAVNSLSSKDMSKSVAPNLIHSMDACLMRMAIVKGLAQGITSYGMVHDSFGVHASEMSIFLNKCVKPAFIEMYKTNVLEDFKSHLHPDLDLPALPKQGDLNQQGVMDSEFFFS